MDCQQLVVLLLIQRIAEGNMSTGIFDRRITVTTISRQSTITRNGLLIE